MKLFDEVVYVLVHDGIGLATGRVLFLKTVDSEICMGTAFVPGTHPVTGVSPVGAAVPALVTGRAGPVGAGAAAAAVGGRTVAAPDSC